MAIQEALPVRLGPYRVLRRIGEGGMGVVHLAADPHNRLVAIKILRPADAANTDTRRRLAHEVQLMRRVRSPFVAEVIDADVTGDVPYLVTRFVPGRSLDEVVTSQGPLRGRALHRLAYGLAEALAAVHMAGIVHRDLKPGNVMMAGDDPVLIDFGIAHLADAVPLTQPGMCVGTPGYLAPEVIEGQPCGPSSDVHAWGATVAFAARGQSVYRSGSCQAVLCQILRGAANLDGIHDGLSPLVAAALARCPQQRPSAAWLARRTGYPGPATPVPPPPGVHQGSAARVPRRHRVPAMTALAIAVAASLVLPVAALPRLRC